MITSGVGVSPGGGMQEMTGLLMLNSGPGWARRPQGEEGGLTRRGKLGLPAVLTTWDSLIGPRLRRPLGRALWELALIC